MVFPARPASIAFWLSLTAALFASPAFAADTGNGSKNFHAPASVPNYFSNEAGPMLGGAAETRRGELYGGAPAAPAAGAPRSHVAVASVPQRAARVVAGRNRARDGHEAPSHRKLAAAPAKPGAHAAARTASNAHVAARATTRTSASHATAKTTKVGSNHRRGRG
jgi:hypothetical protein